MNPRHKNKELVKLSLLEMLRQENAFWSYDPESVTLASIGDDRLIALTLRYLDLPEIRQLFTIFTFDKVKKAWARLLVPEGEYLYTLNRFLAWYFFKAKRPDAYLKSLRTRHLRKLGIETH